MSLAVSSNFVEISRLSHKYTVKFEYPIGPGEGNRTIHCSQWGLIRNRDDRKRKSPGKTVVTRFELSGARRFAAVNPFLFLFPLLNYYRYFSIQVLSHFQQPR